MMMKPANINVLLSARRIAEPPSSGPFSHSPARVIQTALSDCFMVLLRGLFCAD